MAHAILTAIGVDRAGLVDEVSQFIYDRGGNIEDSRMVNLRGQFVMVVLLGGDEATIGKLRHEQSKLAQLSGLQVEVRPTPDQPGPLAGAGAGLILVANVLVALIQARKPRKSGEIDAGIGAAVVD